MIEIEDNGAKGLGPALIVATLCCALFVERPWTPATMVSLALVTLMGALSVRQMIVRAPALRATPAGISFRGSAIIPWHDIDAIYDASDLPHDGTGMRTQKLVQAICVPFFYQRSVYKLPLAMWPAALARKGVRIAVLDVPARLIADLETMRSSALSIRGPEIRAANAAALPAARLHR